MQEDTYEDILFLPHHTSTRHPRMSMEARAAQFAPFAALSGYEASIAERARPTDEKRELAESEHAILNQKIQILLANLDKQPLVQIEYFQKDPLKSGGSYVKTTGHITRITPSCRLICLDTRQEILSDDILTIECPLFI